MNKKGFTLVEILAIIVLLAIVATITTSFITNIIRNTKKEAFKDSVYAAINSYINNESYQSFNDMGEIDVRLLPLDNNPFMGGKVKRNSNNEVVVTNVTDGVYCANGSKNKLIVKDGNCTSTSNQENNNENNNESNNNEINNNENNIELNNNENNAEENNELNNNEENN